MPDGLPTDLDALREQIARLENRCRDLEGVRVADELQRKQAESRLREADEFHRQLIDSVQGLVAYDSDVRYTLWNRFMQELSGLSPADVVGRRPSELFPWAAECGVANVIRRALTGSVAVIDDVHFHFPKTGRSGWSSVRYYPFRNGSGHVIGAIGNVTETTEFRQTQHALRDSEERARIAFAAAHMGAFDWKAGDQKSEYFGNMMGLFGRVPDDEHSGYADFLQSIHPDDRPRVDVAVQRALQHGSDYDVEFRAVWPDGTLHWIAEKGTVLRDAAGKPLRMVGIAMDIDGRKRLEHERVELDARVQQAQKLEMLGTLAGGVAHDFNNLLQVILSNAGLIREQAGAVPAVSGCVAQIETASQRASELTRHLLAYAGKGKFIVESVDLSPLALEMSGLLDASLPKQARVLGQFPPGLPAVEGDPTQVRQVVMNLVLNAAEALPDGNGVIRLATGIVHLAAEELAGLIQGAGLAAGKYVYFEVCDTGCGMTEEARARIFDPFYTTKDKGRGLGLAAVLGIVRGHRGAMQVHSEPGTGTVFRVLFPASDNSARRPAVSASEPPGERSLQGTILVVDDEEAIRNSAKLLLEATGFHVVTAADGREALQIFRTRPAEFSAVLLDLMMPHMTGADVFRELRAVRPDIPILMTSGYSEEEAVRHFQESRLAGFIQKPYRSHQLRARLDEVLHQTVVRAR